MPTRESPGTHNNSRQARSGQRPILDLAIKLLYWQGLGYEPPEPDLDFYLRYFPPRMSKLLVRHRYLRLAVRYFRLSFLHSLMIFATIHFFIVHPLGMFLFWDNKMKVIENLFVFMLYLEAAPSVAIFYFHKTEVYALISRLQHIHECQLFDDEDSKKILTKVDNICHALTKYCHIFLVPGVSSLLIIYFFVGLLPKKILFFEGWYPYDIRKSPAFEITLVVTTFYQIAEFLVMNTILCFIFSSFLYIIAYYKLLAFRMKNIRKRTFMDMRAKELNVARIKPIGTRLMLNESRVNITAVDTITADDHEGKHLAKNARRLENLTMFRPHVQINIPGAVEEETQPVGSAFQVSTWSVDNSECGRRGRQSDNGPARRINRQDMKLRGKTEGNYAECLASALYRTMSQCVQIHQLLLRSTNEFGSLINGVLAVIYFVNMGIFGATVLLVTSETSVSITREMLYILLFLESALVFLILNVLASITTIKTAAVGEAVYACDWLISLPVFYLCVLSFMFPAGDVADAVYASDWLRASPLFYLCLLSPLFQAGDIADAVYASDWLRTSPRFKQSMLIVMSRANCPLVFKPMGLKPFSRTMFIDTSYTAYKMLNTLNSF